MTKRLNLMWAKRLSDTLSMRLTENVNESDADDPEVNAPTCDLADPACTYDAPPEG